jgi:hypothetical protein
MTQEEINKLADEFEDEFEFEEEIKKLGGERFVDYWQSRYYLDGLDGLDVDMIEFMKSYGFEVFEDPYLEEDDECTIWIVFPPEGLKKV